MYREKRPLKSIHYHMGVDITIGAEVSELPDFRGLSKILSVLLYRRWRGLVGVLIWPFTLGVEGDYGHWGEFLCIVIHEIRIVCHVLFHFII